MRGFIVGLGKMKAQAFNAIDPQLRTILDLIISRSSQELILLL